MGQLLMRCDSKKVETCVVAPLNSVSHMSVIYSRAYLKGLPEQMHLGFIEQTVIKYLYEHVKGAAITGKTSYRFPVSLLKPSNHVLWGGNRLINNQSPPPPELTVEELIPIIRSKFPDCMVTYEEAWIDEVRGLIPTKYLSKAIVIDWT